MRGRMEGIWKEKGDIGRENIASSGYDPGCVSRQFNDVIVT